MKGFVVYSEIPEISPLVLILSRLILGAALLMSTWRLFAGPTVADRIVAMELFAAILMAQLILQVVITGFISYLDVALAIAVISFLGTVAFARYLENRRTPL